VRIKTTLFLATLICFGLAGCTATPLTVETTLPPVADLTPGSENHPLPTPTAHASMPPEATPPTTVASPEPAPVDTPAPTQKACQQTGGRIEKGQIDSSLFLDPLEFRVYLPPCYDQEADTYYPVLYLIHGQSYNDDQWDRLGADEAADALISSGEMPPFLIVMPRDRRWTQPDEDQFGEALVQDLIPWVDANYRTIPDRLFRAIGGLSRGGGWALHLGLIHWEVFGAFGVHSLAMFSIDSPFISQWLDSIPLDQMPRIYLDMDDKDRKDLMESTLWLESLLTEKGIPHEWYLYPGYHEEKYWQAHVEQYVRWYAQGWKTEP